MRPGHPADDGGFTYVFDGVRATAGQVLGFSGQMQSEAASTITKFNGLLELGWRGEGADGFIDTCQPIFTHMDNLAKNLDRLAKAVQLAADGMEIADIVVATRT